RVDMDDNYFDVFWMRYPHKVGKAEAKRAFERAMKGQVDFGTLMDGLERYREKRDDRPWCNPSTWLNQARWDDRPNEVNPDGRSLLAAADRQSERLRAGVTRRVGYTPREDDLQRVPPRRLRGPGELHAPADDHSGELSGQRGDVRDGPADRNPEAK